MARKKIDPSPMATYFVQKRAVLATDEPHSPSSALESAYEEWEAYQDAHPDDCQYGHAVCAVDASRRCLDEVVAKLEGGGL